MNEPHYEKTNHAACGYVLGEGDGVAEEEPGCAEDCAEEGVEEGGGGVGCGRVSGIKRRGRERDLGRPSRSWLELLWRLRSNMLPTYQRLLQS